MDGSKGAGAAVKTKGHTTATAGKTKGDAAAATAGQTKPSWTARLVSTLARFPSVPKVIVELQDRVKTLEANLQDLAKEMVKKEKEGNSSMSSYASCDTVEKEPCSECAAGKEEMKYLHDRLQKKDKEIEKLKCLVKDLTK